MGEKQRVWVIGAGITGLTAAHELAERGFEVIVVDCDEDFKRPGSPALGGMARTQWAYLPERRQNEMISTVQPLHPVRFGDTSASLAESDIVRLKRFARDVGACPVQVTGFYTDPSDEILARQRVDAVLSVIRSAEVSSRPVNVVVSEVKQSSSGDECVHVKLNNDIAPGEHGFRFFHGFYRHAFDTMKRIPIWEDRGREYEFTTRTVHDNLSPSDAFGLDFAPGDGQPARAVEFPRRRLTGVRELYDILHDFMAQAGHSSEDIGRISLSIFKYMTSCTQRREEEYEKMSWWDFIDGPTFNEPARTHYRNAPRVLVGLTAEHCDARTQGNVVTQMLIDVLFKGERSDATLNGPTTGVWFDHWREYLGLQDVNFILTKLTGFRTDKDSGCIFPDFEPKLTEQPQPEDFFVLAVSLPALIGDPTLAHQENEGLVTKFLRELGESNWHEAKDFVALRDFAQVVGSWNSADRIEADQSALRHMNGIQFFFPVDVPQKTGRSLYLNSEWQLSSLSQVHYWGRSRLPVDGYRGILSIDIGAWDAPCSGPAGKTAWASDRDTIAEKTWNQVASTVVNRARWYDMKPPWYHIDDHIQFEDDGARKVKRNDAPYLVSRPGDWEMRPGRMPQHHNDLGGYDMQCKRWVLAGTFMKTYTRLTTMESANESARHAVNGILRVADENRKQYPRCKVWDPERAELPDLKWLRELDARLYAYSNEAPSSDGAELPKNAQRLPHFLDILAPDDVTDWLRLVDGGMSTELALRELMTRVMEWRWKR